MPTNHGTTPTKAPPGPPPRGLLLPPTSASTTPLTSASSAPGNTQHSDRRPSPASVLRHAAAYLWRHGWTTEQFYDRIDLFDIDDVASTCPAACTAGAIRHIIFGHPVDFLDEEAIQPGHDRHVRLLNAAQAALTDEIDPTWLCAETCPARHTCALEIINDWNDTRGRTIADVLTALYSAADTWDAAHPLCAPVVTE